jgi:hypothetical protein
MVDGQVSNVEFSDTNVLKVKYATDILEGAVKLNFNIANAVQAEDKSVPTAYTVKNYIDTIALNKLPIASTTTLGGIKIGPNMDITADGVLKLNLPLASFE